MPSQLLEQQIVELRQHLDENGDAFSSERQAQLQELITQIELQLELDAMAPQADDLRESLEQAVDMFELEHPTLSTTLRMVMQTLANMGI